MLCHCTRSVDKFPTSYCISDVRASCQGITISKFLLRILFPLFFERCIIYLTCILFESTRKFDLFVPETQNNVFVRAWVPPYIWFIRPMIIQAPGRNKIRTRLSCAHLSALKITTNQFPTSSIVFLKISIVPSVAKKCLACTSYTRRRLYASA